MYYNNNLKIQTQINLCLSKESNKKYK